MSEETRPGKCLLCGDTLDPGGLQDVLDHLRVHHPQEYGDGPERWPDGMPVLEVDASMELTAEDFEAPGE